MHSKREEGGRIMPECSAEVLIETIYTEVVENIAADVCRECPVIEFLRELRHTIKDMTHEQIMTELGVTFSTKACPCAKEFNESR